MVSKKINVDSKLWLPLNLLFANTEIDEINIFERQKP